MFRNSFQRSSIHRTEISGSNRLYNLDYLRGLAAFGIMVYHYLTWTQGKFSVDTFIGRVGIYGVSVFYILSGLTLYFVYYGKMSASLNDIKSFFRKRIFRIFPLLWLVTIAAIVISQKKPDYYDLFLNLSGLFGFIKWDTYFSTGIWSIGNELVFYVFFPLFVILSKKSRIAMIILSLIIFATYLYFAFVIIDPDVSLSLQWKEYVNPLNQVFLFLCGFLTGLILQNKKVDKKIISLALLTGLAVFYFYPVSGDPVNIVSGINRLIFTVCCLLICIGFYKLSFRLPQFIHLPLSKLGEASYSVYLLHPVIYTLSGHVSGFFRLSQFSRIIIAGIATLMISYFVYEYFEKYFMRRGRS